MIQLRAANGRMLMAWQLSEYVQLVFCAPGCALKDHTPCVLMQPNIRPNLVAYPILGGDCLSLDPMQARWQPHEASAAVNG